MRTRALSLRAAATLAATFAAGAAHAGAYRLPWPPGLRVELPQDCNDSRYADHTGHHGYAWDFAADGPFPVAAARAGIVTQVKQSSARGCGSPACVDLANYVVVDHGDGTAGVYLHLEGGSLDPPIACGARVERGQRLGLAGATGWATGPHLHFQVVPTPAARVPTCECGPRGEACADDVAAWASFWSSAKRPAQAIRFDEWDAATCGDRRVTLPESMNVPGAVDALVAVRVSPRAPAASR